MKKILLICALSSPLLAGCSALIGSTGQDTSFEQQGTLDCANTDVQTQELVVGTQTNPVRCGPQSQAIPR